MGSELIWWSAEKQQHLANQLTGFWAEDTWLFTSQQGKTYQMSFPLPASALQAEIKYALRTKFESGRWKTNGNLSPMCREVKAIEEWLKQLPLMPSSFMQKPLDHWEMSLRSYLVQTGHYRRGTGRELSADQTYVERWEEDSRIRLLRQIYTIVAQAYDDREETEKDVWDMRHLGVTLNLTASGYLLNFTPIAQQWLRSLAKTFIKYNLSVHSPGDCLAKMQTLREFSRFLTAHHSTVGIAEINRTLIVSFLNYLKAQGKTSHRVMTHLIHLRAFLEGCAYHLNIVGLTKERLILEGDFPKLPQSQPRDLPAEVLGQLREHLETLPTTVLRMVVILLEGGLRISELCTLRLSCLVHDDRNEWYLHFYQWKAKQEHVIPLVDEAVVAAIQAQQHAIRERWGDACQYLFPSPLFPQFPFKARTFTRMLNEWAYEKQICDQSGKLYHFQSHQFRHTLGMQLINEDVPLDVISRLFGHGSLSMTQRYAHKRAAKLRAELERASRKRKTVNAVGQVVTGDPHANDPDAQLLRKGIRGQTLPVGGCGRLIVLGGCPHANTCVTCTYWLTSTDDLPALNSFYQRAVHLKQRATEVGNQMVAEQQDRIIPKLALRIKSLEDPGTDAGLSVDELLSGLRSDLAEAESGLEEAREAGLPLAAKHVERTMTDLKMRISALEETI
jgi:integrase/recombinase XerD